MGSCALRWRRRLAAPTSRRRVRPRRPRSAPPRPASAEPIQVMSSQAGEAASRQCYVGPTTIVLTAAALLALQTRVKFKLDSNHRWSHRNRQDIIRRRCLETPGPAPSAIPRKIEYGASNRPSHCRKCAGQFCRSSRFPRSSVRGGIRLRLAPRKQKSGLDRHVDVRSVRKRHHAPYPTLC